MKYLPLISAVACLLAMPTGASADVGPYYVSYPGYCNVKKIYINANNDLYCYEIGCSSTNGVPLIGVITAAGNVDVSTVSASGLPCINKYYTNGTLGGGCSNGSSISYAATSYYTVMEAKAGGGNQDSAVKYQVSTQQPDLASKANLPPLPF